MAELVCMPESPGTCDSSLLSPSLQHGMMCAMFSYQFVRSDNFLLDELQDLEERAVGDRVDEWMADVMSRDRRWIHSALPSDVVNVPKDLSESSAHVSILHRVHIRLRVPRSIRNSERAIISKQ